MESRNNTMVAVLFTTFSLLAWGSPRAARADTSPPRDPRASLLEEQARLAVATDELPEAYAALRALLAIEPSTDTFCRLGMVARRLGYKVEAAENLDECVRALSAAPIAASERARYEGLRTELAMARAAVAAVTLSVPAGTRVTVDDGPEIVADPGRTYFFEPGPHTIALLNERRRVYLLAGKETALGPRAPAKAPPKVPPTSPPKAAGPSASAPSMAVLAGGIVVAGALLGAGAALHLLAEERDKEARSAMATQLTAGGCLDKGGDVAQRCAAFQDARDVGIAFQQASVASFVVGSVVALGAGGYALRAWTDAPKVVVGASSVKVVMSW